MTTIKKFSLYLILILLVSSSILFAQINDNNGLNAFWIEAERQVKEGDFEAYSTSFHHDAILVNVCHKKFKAYTTNDYEQLSNGEKVIIDIKNSHS